MSRPSSIVNSFHNLLPVALRSKLAGCGYSELTDLAHQTREQFLATCRLSLKEFETVEALMLENGIKFKPDVIHYPFISPLLQNAVTAAGINLSQTSITTIGLPTWAETPLLAGGIESVQALVGSSTFYIRVILGFGGRPQNILRQRVEEHLLRLLDSVQRVGPHGLGPHGPAGDPGGLDAQLLQSLPLPSRTLNSLRRAGIFTVEQLTRLSDTELARLPGLGHKGRSEILRVLPDSKALQVPAADTALQVEAVAVRPDVAGRPLRQLGLTDSIVRRLQSAGMNTIGDLVAAGDEGLLNIPRIGKRSEELIRQALEQYLLSELESVGESVPDIVAEVQADSATSTLDAKIYGLIQHSTSDRVAQALTLRFGLQGRVWTLEEVGRRLGISRERARQLECAGIMSLRKHHSSEIENLARPAHELLAAVGGVAPYSYLLEQLPTVYKLDALHVLGAARFLLEITEDKGSAAIIRQPGGNTMLAGAPLKAVEALDDALVSLLRKRMGPMSVDDLTANIARIPSYARVLRQYSSFSLAARVRANYQTEVLPSGLVALREWARTRLDETVAALRRLANPSHYRQIAAQVQLTAPEGTFVSVEAIHNLLLTEATFIRVGRGTFGLAEWQQAGPDLVGELVAMLRNSDRPLHRSELAQALLLQERDVERCLLTRPEFVPAGDGPRSGYYRLEGHEYSERATLTAPNGKGGAARRSRSEVTAGPTGTRFARVRISQSTHRSGILALNEALKGFFTGQGELRACLPRSDSDEGTYTLHRGKAHLSGLRGFIRSARILPGENLYIEHVPGPVSVYNLYTEDQWRATVISNVAGEESNSSSDS